MPSEIWYPISSATHNLPAGHDQWNNTGGANKNASTRPGGGRTGPTTHDDDTTRIEEGSGFNGLNRSQCLNPDWPGPVGSFIALSINFRTRSSGGASTRAIYMMNAAGTAGTVAASTADGTDTYVEPGANISDGPTYRPGGGDWGPSDFADDQTMFPRVFVSVSNNSLVTSIWGALNYNPPSGGFAFLLNLAGLGALPFVGHMADFAQFRSYLSWRRRFHPRHTIMTPNEIVRAWDEIRAYKHPTFFLPRFA